MEIIISFIVSFMSILLLRPLAIKYNLVDNPNKRKNHVGNVPLVGGIAIFLGLLASQVYQSILSEEILIILVSSFLILTLGIWDDFVDLNAYTKLIAQILLIILTIYFSDIKIENLGFLFSSTNTLELGVLSIPFTVLAVIGLTNSFNMIDGLDGLAGSLVIIAIVGMLINSFHNDASIFTNLLLALVAGLIAFLIFNIFLNSKHKIFLGDGGSLLLGFIVCWVLISNSQRLENFTPSYALWCVSVPLFDFFSVITLRKIEKHPITIANKDHIHHFLETFGFSKKAILTILTVFALVMLYLGYYIEKNNSFLSFVIFITLFFLYLCTRIYLKKK